LPSPETGSQNPHYRALSRQQRQHAGYLNPRKRPQNAGYSSETGKRRFASDCVVADALALEPVSTPKFPFIRENNREFCESDALSIDCRRQTAHISGRLAKIPCEIESGIFCREPGHFRQANGKFSQRQLEGAPFANTRHKRWSWRLNPEPRARLRAFRTLAAVPFICEERPPCLYSTRTWVRSPVVV
jgi:hypothetical protein